MRPAFVVVMFVVAVLAGSPLAQQAAQRGTIKQVDAARARITITAADGKDVDCAIVPKTTFRDAANQPIANFTEKGLPAGTPVMFKVEARAGQTVLLALRVAPSAAQPTARGKGGAQRSSVPRPPAPRDSIGVTPLTELGTGTYKGETGGLYGDGRNEPPPQQQKAAKTAAERIQPLDTQGKPSAAGKIVLLGVGMSNTTLEFSTFKKLADADPQKSTKVALIDVAQGGQAAEQWIDPASDAGRRVWGTVDQRLKAAGVASAQVQVVWIKQALIAEAQFGEFPAHARTLENDLIMTLHLLKQRFPNLQLAYLSSRIYAGYATTSLNPEPYAYEGAFSIRWIIDAQVKGDPKLNADAARGPVQSPVVLWGPYLWADGTTPRKDGLVWNRSDLRDTDGTHPSPSGQQKVADMLMAFFHSDPYARSWYLK